MKLDLEKTGGNLIRAFAGGELLIGSERFSQPLIVTSDRIITDWHPPPPAQLRLDDLRRLLELQPETILLGTGTRQVFPDLGVITSILQSGIGIEVMTTAAACRTFNVLVSEYRHVAAALFVA